MITILLSVTSKTRVGSGQTLYIYIHTHTYIYIYAHTYIYSYLHAYTHTTITTSFHKLLINIIIHIII